MCVIDRPDTKTDVRPEARNEIATSRLKLRRPQLSDAGALARLAADYAIASMTTRMPYPYGEGDARHFVSVVAGQDRKRENTFVVEHPDEGVIGAVGFHETTDAWLEMGYWIGRPYWGQGYATETTRAALHWAEHDWRRKVVIAGHFTDNPASANVLIKAGFLYTGQVQNRHSRARGQIAPTRMMVWLA
jgi:RimJ/RimL family protein N-acetyltransferase